MKNKQDIMVDTKSRKVGCKKFEVVKNIFSFNFRNQKSRRDDMSVENTFPTSKKSRRDDMSVLEDFQEFEQKAGLDRHVIPTGFYSFENRRRKNNIL
ncbi:MAG: hypothetical protein LBQ01_02815 [Prevotellaceae bacterium]|jgi:hypothetical protein|nr:hypothetical protein [Prevotellaceae bacterium]